MAVNYNVFPQPGGPVVGQPNGFSNIWTGPQQNPPGSATPGPRPVVSALVNFSDGQRSVVGCYRYNFPLPSDWPTNARKASSGWRPLRVDPSTSYANWSPYLDSTNMASGGVDKSRVANYDEKLSDGYVVFYLDGNLGSAGAKSGRSWPPGWWAYPAEGVWAGDLANFQWATSQLAGGMTQVVNAVGASQGRPPMPMPAQTVAIVGPPPPPPGISPIAKVAAVVVVVAGVLYYLL